MSNNNTFFGDIANAMEDDPSGGACILISLFCGVFSAPAMLMSLALFIIFKFCPIQWYFSLISIALGAIGIAIVTSYFTIPPSKIYQTNIAVLYKIFWGIDNRFFAKILWLVSLPYALVLGPILAAIKTKGASLAGEINLSSSPRFSTRQQQITASPYLSDRKLNKKLRKIPHAAVVDGTTLGVNRRIGSQVYLMDHDANLHTLVIGTTGCGKTTGILNIIESAMIRYIPLIYVDGKGDCELQHRVQTMAEKYDVPCYTFSMVGPSMKYNPIASGGITSLKDRIIELRTWSEDHYRKLAEGYLQQVFKLIKHAKIPVDLVSLAKYIESDAWFELGNERDDREIIAAAQELEEISKDIGSLKAEIKNLAQSEIGDLFDCSSGDVITLDKALSEPCVIYFCLQPLAFPAYAATLGKLIINDIKAYAAKQLAGRTSQKIFTIFDEFSVFAGDQIINLINQGRSAGLHAVLSTQSLSDIEQKGNEALVGQVLNNCNNYIIQRQNYPKDAEILANIIGTRDGYSFTSQYSRAAMTTGTGSVRKTKEFIVHPDDIKRLSLGEAIYVNKQTFNAQKMLFRVPR